MCSFYCFFAIFLYVDGITPLALHKTHKTALLDEYGSQFLWNNPLKMYSCATFHKPEVLCALQQQNLEMIRVSSFHSFFSFDAIGPGGIHRGVHEDRLIILVYI